MLDRARLGRGVGLFLSICFASLAVADHICPLQPVAGEGPNKGVLRLTLDRDLYAAAEPQRTVTFTGMALPDGSFVDLDLTRFEVFSPDAVFRHVTEAGEVAVPRPDVQLWRGEIAGRPLSRVYLALTPHGTSGYVMTGAETLIISTGKGGADSTLIFSLSDAPAGDGAPLPVCAGAIPVEGDVLPPPNPSAGSGYSPRVYNCRNFRIAIDCDYEFTQALFGGNQTNSAAYATSLLGAVSEIYSRDMNVTLSVPYLRTWGSSDPYTSANTSDQLPQFRTYWNQNMGSVSRNLAHLLSGRNLGGGIAYLRVACSSGNGYAVSANLDGFFPYPLVHRNWQNWDVVVTAHELGHNLGTGHTHDTGFYNPIIDGCGSSPQNCTNANQGTIMSYCHTCGGGMSNINLTFGTRVIEVMRAYMDTNVPNCGTQPQNTTFSQHPTPQSVLAGQPATFAVTTSGATPFTHQWRKDGTNLSNNARISGATSPTLSINPVQAGDAGDYECVITNGCGTLASNEASLSIITCPTIISQPVGTTVAAGETAALTALANGTNPRTYQWRRDTTPISDGNGYSGANAYRLYVNNANPGHAGSYDVIVSNACGSVTSDAVTLIIATNTCGSADFDGDGDTGTDGDIEAFFACLGGNCCGACGSADFDGDGDTGTDSDIEAFFRVLGGGVC